MAQTPERPSSYGAMVRFIMWKKLAAGAQVIRVPTLCAVALPESVPPKGAESAPVVPQAPATPPVEPVDQ
jgi:hypothetical protein